MENKKLKVGIIGLGPVGMILAVHFKEAGCEVSICDVGKDKMTLIRNEGIELVGYCSKKMFFQYNFSSVNDLLEQDLDILISAVKSYRVDTILDQIEKYKHNGVLLLCAQNGIDIGYKYTSHFNESQILRMVINFAGVLNAPNVANVTFFDPPNFIASKNDTHGDTVQLIADLLTSVGLKTEFTDSFTIADHVWKKTMMIASISPLCGISEMTIREAISNPDMMEIVEQTLMESIEVARAEGIKFSDNFPKLVLRSLRNTGNHLPSLAVDIMNNHETEIDHFNGKIVEYGRKHYIPTPLNLIFLNLVKAITSKANKS